MNIIEGDETLSAPEGTPKAAQRRWARCGWVGPQYRQMRNVRHAPKMRLVLAGAALACALLAGCSNPSALPPAAATTPHDVTLTRVQQRSIHVMAVQPSAYRTSITTMAAVDFDRNHAAAVVAPFSGSVAQVLVTLGAKVKRGQPLARVVSPDYATAAGTYRKALLVAQAADSIAANDRALFAHQAISARENAAAQADAAGANAERAAARQALVALHMDAKTIAAIGAGKVATTTQGVIRAPIAGTVVKKSIAPGQTLAAGATPCFTIADTAKLWVQAQVFGTDVAQVAMGDAATVDPGDGEKLLAGKVTRMSAVVDPGTRALAARIAVANPNGVLKPGMYVTANIQSQAPRHGILLPVSAVLRNEQDLPFVYRVTKRGGYARQRVTLGARVGERFAIASGLAAGESVVTDGSIFLRFIQNQ